MNEENYKKIITKNSAKVVKLSLWGFNIYSSYYKDSALIRRIFFLKLRTLDLRKMLNSELTMFEKRFSHVSNDHASSGKTKLLGTTSVSNKEFSIEHKLCNEAIEKYGAKNLKELFSCLEKYYTGRIDIQNYGINGNSIKILECDDPNVVLKKLCINNETQGNGYAVQSTKTELTLKFECQGSGILNIRLRSKDYKFTNGKEIRIPIFIHYKSLSINNKDLLSNDGELITHDKPYYKSEVVTDKQVITVQLKWASI